MLAVLRSQEAGLRRGDNFWLRLTTASVQCLRLSERFFRFCERYRRYKIPKRTPSAAALNTVPTVLYVYCFPGKSEWDELDGEDWISILF